MTEELMSMKLFLCMQNFKKAMQMPFLEEVCAEKLPALSQLEDELITCRVGLLVCVPREELERLQENNYLDTRSRRKAFLARNKIHLVSGPYQLHPKLDVHAVDIAVYVVSNAEQLQDAVSDREVIQQAGGDPLTMVLLNTDGQEDIAEYRRCTTSAFAQFEKEDAPICYLTCSLSKSVQAQEMMNNRQMVESNFLSVKKNLQMMACSAMKRRVRFRIMEPFCELVLACKEKLDEQAAYHQKKMELLRDRARKIARISIGSFVSDLQRECRDACKMTACRIILEERPENTAAAKTKVTGSVSAHIQTAVVPQICTTVQHAVYTFEEYCVNQLDPIFENLFWVSEEERDNLGKPADFLQKEHMPFSVPGFTMCYDDFEPITGTTESSEIERIIENAVRKSTARYELTLQNAVQQWFTVEIKQCEASIREKLDALNDTIPAALEEHRQQADRILTGDTYAAVEELLSEANALKKL